MRASTPKVDTRYGYPEHRMTEFKDQMNANRKPRYDASGRRVINANQVNLLIALGIQRNLRGDKLLEFIEFECDCNVTKLEDIPDGPTMVRIVAKLKEGL